MRMLRICLVLLAGAWSMVSLEPALAAKKGIELSAEQLASFRKIADYIQSITYLQGEFTQVSPKGNVSSGMFFISRPGKMRFEYAPPNPFLIVSDGRWVTIKNRSKEKGDQFPLSATPLRLVLSENVDFLKETEVLGFEHSDGLTTIEVEDRNSSVAGQLILVFDETRNELQQWVVVDGKGRRTTVTLGNQVAGLKPDPELFEVKIVRDQFKKN